MTQYICLLSCNIVESYVEYYVLRKCKLLVITRKYVQLILSGYLDNNIFPSRRSILECNDWTFEKKNKNKKVSYTQVYITDRQTLRVWPCWVIMFYHSMILMPSKLDLQLR